MGYASSNFIFIINHPSVIFHYAVRLVQSPSLIIAVCSVAGNYLVTVFCTEMWVGAEYGRTKENQQDH